MPWGAFAEACDMLLIKLQCFLGVQNCFILHACKFDTTSAAAKKRKQLEENKKRKREKPTKAPRDCHLHSPIPSERVARVLSFFSEISSIGSFPAKNEQFQYSHTKIKSSVRPIGKVAGNTARSLHSLGVESDKEQESRGAQQQLSVMGILKE